MGLGWWLAGIIAGSLPIFYLWMDGKGWLGPRGSSVPTHSIVLVMKDMEGRAEGILRSVLAFQARHFPRGQIVAVNDGSMDETGPILRRMSRGTPNLKVLSLLPGGSLEPCQVGLELADGREAWLFVLPPQIHPDDLLVAMERALGGRQGDPVLEWLQFRKVYRS